MSLGTNLPNSFTMEVECSLTIALNRSYTRFASDLAGLFAGPLATSETRALFDVIALFTVARAIRAAAAAPQPVSSPRASTSCGGGGGGPSGGHSSCASSLAPYGYPSWDTVLYRSPPPEMGPQTRESDREHDHYHYSDRYRDGAGRGGGNDSGSEK